MIISFSFENWMSFRDRTEFSMVASRERQHNDRVPFIEDYNLRVVAIASIYGGNASGKTNFFKALNFMKRLVVRGTRVDSRIPIDQFRLDPECLKKPSTFEITIFTKGKIYEYSFSVTPKRVVEEKLTWVRKTTEWVLFHRQNDQIKLHQSLPDKQFLSFAFKGTRDNQLFLTNTVSQNIDQFRPVYDWFRYKLELVSPDARFEPFEELLDESHLHTDMNELLPQLDTGIESLGGEEIPFDNIVFPKELKEDLLSVLNQHDGDIRIKVGGPGERFVISREGEKVVAKKLVTYRRMWDGETTRFDMSQESDGTQRIIDLLPAIIELTEQEESKVYIIDELDRSLHTLLLQQLITLYLQNCSVESRSQLLFTTHDMTIMDQNLFRRDEMWVTEREPNGCSTLYSFSDYREIRSDKDIRKSYLEGGLGGIPRFLMSDMQFRNDWTNDGDD